MVLAWAALRSPNGAIWFVFVIIAFLLLQVAIPALRRLWSLPAKPASDGNVAPAIATLLLIGLISTSCSTTSANTPPLGAEVRSPVPESVSQRVRIEEEFALVTATIRWQTEKNAVLPLLVEPAVLTRFTNPKDAFKLKQVTLNGKRVQQLVAQRSGTFDIELQYQVQVGKRGQESGFALPTPCGLVNQLNLTATGLDVDVFSPQAVSVHRDRKSVV